MMPMGGASPADSPANDQSESISASVPDPVKMTELRPQVFDALKTIYDPEIPVNIVELGLIYDVLVDADAKVGVRMTLTAPACPAAQILPGEVREKASKVAGVSDARVEIVWDPPWSKRMLSQEARDTLLEFGVAT